MTCPGLILWSQLPECNVKIKGSTNEHRKKPIMKGWDSSKTSQTHVWSPTFSPRNGPKSLSLFFFIIFVSLDMFSRSTQSLQAMKPFYHPAPLNHRSSFPTTRHQQEEGHNTCPPKPDFFTATMGMVKGDTKEAFFETEFLDVLHESLLCMRNSGISWGFLWCDGGPEIFGNMMWCNIMDVYPVPKTWHHQVHHPQHHPVTPPPLLVSLKWQ